MKIAIGGLSHETNILNPVYTRLSDFHKLDLMRDPSTEFLLGKGAEVITTLYAAALPSGLVAKKAYLQMKEELLEPIESAKRIDGVCLLLHGAMLVEGVGSGEDDLVRGVREIVGSEALISLSLDLHGNVSRDLCKSADILTAYRTAPHVDEAETRIKAASMLLTCIEKRIRPVPVMVKPPVLLPGEFLVTDTEPAHSLYQSLADIDKSPGIIDSSLLVGMALADIPHAGASVVVVAEGKEHAEDAYGKARHLAKSFYDKRKQFHLEVESGQIDETIRIAKNTDRRPVFISDSGDNVTAGAAGDIPLFLERLLSLEVSDAVVGGITDAEAVDKSRKAGLGSELKVQVGGKIDRVNGSPLEVKGRVMKLSSEGAVLRIDNVDVILTAKRTAFTTLDDFKAYGINPLERKIVVVKLGYLFPNLRKVAALALMAISPGITPLFIDQLEYTHVKRPIFPLDRDFEWEPPQSL